MGGLAIIYDNAARSAIFSGGDWTLPLSNVVDGDVGSVARSNGATAAASKLKFDIGAPRQIGGIAVGPINLAPGSFWQVSCYSDSAYLTQTYTSGVLAVEGETIDWSDEDEWLEWENPSFWLGYDSALALNELPQYLYHLIPEASLALASQQYWLIEFIDTTNPAGNIEFGELVAGPVFRPSNNYLENSFSISDLTGMEETLAGRRVYNERGIRRLFRCTCEHLDNSELFGDIFAMAARSGVSKPVFFIPDDEEAVYQRRRSFLATFKQPPPIIQALADRGSAVFDVEEVL